MKFRKSAMPFIRLFRYDGIASEAGDSRKGGYFMEYIIISNTKIKIMLTQKELDKYNIDGESLSIANEDQRLALRRVLNDACRQSGFNSSASRLMVQMFPAKRGGCEIFVTRLDGSSCGSCGCVLGDVCSDEGAVEENCACFTFYSFKGLNAVCRHLHNTGYSGDSDIYISEGGVYYLILSKSTLSDSAYTRLSFINEFAKSATDGVPGYIYEHGRPVCEGNAVEIIGKL